MWKSHGYAYISARNLFNKSPIKSVTGLIAGSDLHAFFPFFSLYLLCKEKETNECLWFIIIQKHMKVEKHESLWFIMIINFRYVHVAGNTLFEGLLVDSFSSNVIFQHDKATFLSLLVQSILEITVVALSSQSKQYDGELLRPDIAWSQL